MKRSTIALAGVAAVTLLTGVGCSHKTVIEDHRDDKPAVIKEERVIERDRDRDYDSGRTYERHERETIERR